MGVEDISFYGSVVSVSTDRDIKICNIDMTYKGKCSLINADCLEIVKTEFMTEFFSGFTMPGCVVAMMVDESGAVKGLPVNLLASYLYGSHLHGNYIYGDVFFFELSSSGFDHVLSEPDAVAAHLTHLDFSLYEDGFYE